MNNLKNNLKNELTDLNKTKCKKSTHKNIVHTVYFKLGLTAALVYLLTYYWGKIEGIISVMWNAITPIVVGIIIAYVVNILMCFIERWYSHLFHGQVAQKCKRGVCIILSFVVLILIVSLVIGLLVPQLVSCISLLISRSGIAAEHLTNFMDSVPALSSYADMIKDAFTGADKDGELTKKIVEILQYGNTGWINNLTSVLQKVTGFATSMLIGLCFSFYLLYDKEKLQRQSKSLIRTYCPEIHERLFEILAVFNNSFRSFIVGQVEDACVLGVMCGIAMFIFRMPYYGMIAVIIAVTALIPIVGAIIGAVVGFVLILSISVSKAFLFVGLFLVVQQIDNNVTYPRIVGGSIGLPGIWVLAAVTIGGTAFGVFGMLFLIPIFSAIYKLVQMDMRRRNAMSEATSDIELEAELMVSDEA